MSADPKGLREAVERLERRDVHDGYDAGGNYIWEDFVRLDDVRRLIAALTPATTPAASPPYTKGFAESETGSDLTQNSTPGAGINEAREAIDWLKVSREHEQFALKGPWIGVQTPHYALSGLFKAMGDEIAALRKAFATTPALSEPEQRGGEEDVSWEVWEDDMMVASSSTEADALHYLAVYSQDGPVRLVKAVTHRFPLAAATPATKEQADGGR